MRSFRGIVVSTFMIALSAGGFVHADEGMWVFNNLPLEQLKEKYGFEPTPEWLEHLRSSAVRFNSGGSGSFVSADGLVMTNHHVGADMLQKISTQGEGLLQGRLPRQDPRRGGEGPRPGAERPGGHRGRDRPGQRGGEARHGRRGGLDRPARGDGRRSRRSRWRRPACGATSSRSTRAGSTTSTLQEVHRRPPGVRPRVRHRVLRRRPRQLRVSRATTSTSASSASTRTASRPSSSTT